MKTIVLSDAEFADLLDQEFSRPLALRPYSVLPPTDDRQAPVAALAKPPADIPAHVSVVFRPETHRYVLSIT